MNHKPQKYTPPLEETVLTPNGGLARRCHRIKRDGEQCRNPARSGFRICAKHGAGTSSREQAGERLRAGRPPTHGLYTAKGRREIADVIAELEAANVNLDDTDGELRVLRATLAYLLSKATLYSSMGDEIERVMARLAEAEDAPGITAMEGAALGRAMAEARGLLIASEAWVDRIVDTSKITVTAVKWRAETNAKLAETRAFGTVTKFVSILRHMLWDVLDDSQLDVIEERLRREVFLPMRVRMPSRDEEEGGLEA